MEGSPQTENPLVRPKRYDDSSRQEIAPLPNLARGRTFKMISDKLSHIFGSTQLYLFLYGSCTSEPAT